MDNLALPRLCSCPTGGIHTTKMLHKVKRISHQRDWQLHSPQLVTCRGYCRVQLFLCVAIPAAMPEEPVLAQASPHLQEPRVQQQCHDKMHSIRWGGSKPNRTVTAQSQGKENTSGFYSESLGRGSAPGRGSSRSYTHMHTHTRADTWSLLLVLTVSYHPCITPDKKQANFLSILL